MTNLSTKLNNFINGVETEEVVQNEQTKTVHKHHEKGFLERLEDIIQNLRNFINNKNLFIV